MTSFTLRKYISTKLKPSEKSTRNFWKKKF